VYHGSPTSAGLQSSWAWSVESNQISAHYGASVGAAGDVNGDGYADIIVGAPNYDSSSELRDEGQAYVYYGNSGRGVSLQPRQQQVDGQPLAHLGLSGDWTQFRVSLRARTPFGRGRIQLEVEAKPLGVPFDGSETFTWGGSQNTVPGADRYLVPHSLHAGTPVHWRARWRYAPSTTPWMPASRWVTTPWNGWNEMDLRTGGDQASSCRWFSRTTEAVAGLAAPKPACLAQGSWDRWDVRLSPARLGFRPGLREEQSLCPSLRPQSVAAAVMPSCLTATVLCRHGT
jgi:hypothetical protein